MSESINTVWDFGECFQIFAKSDDLYIRFKCPRCEKEQTQKLDVVSQEETETIFCQNPDCNTGRKLNFVIQLIPRGWYPGRTDSPVECHTCGQSYDYDEDYNFRPVCDCQNKD